MQIDPSALARARAFIASVDWVFARTMAHYNPHEYVHERAAGGPAFDEFVALIEAGEVRRYKGTPYRYVTVDEHDYWTTHGGGLLINRKESASAGWDD